MPLPLTEYKLRVLLERGSGQRIELALNRNRVSYVTFEESWPRGAVKLRLQRAFLEAPQPVLRALANWIRTCRGRCPRAVRAFIDSRAESDPRPPRQVRTRTAGRHHDLAEIGDGVNRECFRGRLDLRISWGRAVKMNRRVWQRQLGSYDRSRNLVVINPVLDREAVPRYFVAFVVFHEMLHAVQPGDSARHHDREFQSTERMHPDYRRATAWQRRNISLLMNPRASRGRKRPAKERAVFQRLLF